MWAKIEQKLSRILDIKSNEKVVARWSFMLAFLIGSAQCYLSAVPISLFLTRFSSVSLPQVYLVVAVLSIVLGFIYTFIGNRLSFNRLMLSLILVTGGVTTLLWFLLTETNSIWIIAVLMVWAIVAYDLLDLGLWTVINQIYNLQQGKRLFGIIGASQSIGGIAAGLLLPLLLIFVATKQIVLLIGLLIFASLAILACLLKTQTSPDDEEVDDKTQNTISTLFQSKYILKLMCLVILGVFAMYIVDILFNTLANEHYPSEAALAGFLGVFFGLANGLNFLLSTFVFTWLLTQYGVVMSLLILPVLGIIISVFLIISHLIPLFAILIFWLAVSLKLFEKAIRTSISDMSNLLLLQPLTPSLRAFTLSKTDTFFIPLATAIISLILLGVTNTWGIVIPAFALAVFVCYVIYVSITLTLKSDYIKILTQAIANRYAITSEFQQINKESLPLFRKALLSPYSDEVIYALSTIERIDKTEFFKEMKRFFSSDKIDIRLYVLEKIKQYQLMSFYPDVISLLDKESNNSLKALAIQTLAHLNYSESRVKIKNLLTDNSSCIFCSALITIWRYDDSSTKQEAFARVSQMLSSDQKKLRKSAAFIIGEVNAPNTYKLLLRLLVDSSVSVKREALGAVLKTKQVEYFDELLNHLNILHLRGDLLHRFLELGAIIIPIINQNFLSYSHQAQLKLLYVMGHMKLSTAVMFLENAVLTYRGALQQTALRSLAKVSQPKTKSFLEKLHYQIQEEAIYLAEQQAFLQLTPELELTGLLRDVFNRKISLSIERLLLSIVIYYHDQPMMKVKTCLESGNFNEISYAIELLERVLDSKHRRALSPILTHLFLAESEINEDLYSSNFQKLLTEHLHVSDNEPTTILTCIACLYIIKALGTQSFSVEIDRLKNSELAIVQETLDWLTQ